MRIMVAGIVRSIVWPNTWPRSENDEVQLIGGQPEGMRGSTMHTISYLGIRCELWSAGNRWFWRISDPRCLRTAVGVAANRAEAVGDARLSIEEMTARVAGHPNLAEC